MSVAADSAERDLVRVRGLFGLAARAEERGVAALSDEELVRLFDEHRWAVRRLARPGGDPALRSQLNAAAMRAERLLHRRSDAPIGSLAASLRRAGSPLLVSTLVFVAAIALSAAAVLADPVVAYALVPRELMRQIEESAWRVEASASTDLGMTLFYWGNNLRASLLALGLGVLGALPGLAVVAYNGLLLGAVAASAAHLGVFDRLVGWIAPHGVPELAALVVAGAIGAALGQSWLIPGARRRRDALAEAGRELTPLVLVAGGLVVCAAPLEGFVAPLELPRWLDLGIACGWVLVLGLGARYSLGGDRKAA